MELHVVSEESSTSGIDIFTQVLRTKFGLVKGLGHSFKHVGSSSIASNLEVKNLIKDLGTACQEIE